MHVFSLAKDRSGYILVSYSVVQATAKEGTGPVCVLTEDAVWMSLSAREFDKIILRAD